jgi:hypothetical protein
MKQKNSTEYDSISSRILEYCIEEISKPLGHIFNVSLEQGVYPERMKYASLRHIYKTGEKSDMSNYRPISLLIAFSKVLERVMYNRLKQHIDTNNIIASKQFGFRENRNTETAIYTLTNHILKALEQCRQTVGTFCDLTKAFDCVIHDILLSKLIVYGICGKVIMWLKSYLEGRKEGSKELNYTIVRKGKVVQAGKLLNMECHRDQYWAPCCF